MNSEKLNSIAPLLFATLVAAQNAINSFGKEATTSGQEEKMIIELASILQNRDLVNAMKEVIPAKAVPAEKEFTNSTQVKKGSYKDGTLTITFVKGNVYEYYNVPAGVWKLLVDAESIGKAFSAVVKGKYEYTEI